MEDQFALLISHSEASLSGERPNQQIALEETIALWRKLHAQGISAYDFSHALLNTAESVMLTFDSLDEATIFAEFMQESSAIMLRSIQSHWPPIDPNDWPDRA